MAKGTSKKAIPYILSTDEGVSKEEQTIFMLRPLKGFDSADILSRFSRTKRVGRGGFEEIDAGRYRKADREQFVDIVAEVRNFLFSEDYPELHAKGWIKSIKDSQMIALVGEDLTLDEVAEIIEFSSNVRKRVPEHLENG